MPESKEAGGGGGGGGGGPAPGAPTCRHCGRVGHSRRTSKQCLQYVARRRRAPQGRDAAAGAGGAGAAPAPAAPAAAGRARRQPPALATYKPSKRFRLAYFNKSIGRQMRLSDQLHEAHAGHAGDGATPPGRCVMCGSRVRVYCTVCSTDDTKIFLCRKRPTVDTPSCFQQFHQDFELQPPY